MADEDIRMLDLEKQSDPSGGFTLLNKAGVDYYAKIEELIGFFAGDYLGEYTDKTITINSVEQIITYKSKFYRLKKGSTVPFITIGIDDASWKVDSVNFIELVDFVAHSELGDLDGLKHVGRCPDLATLATIEPTADGQVIDVVAYGSGWGATGYGTPFGGGRWVHLSKFTADKYPADGGTIVVTPNKNVWIREELFTSKKPEIYVEWFGADNTFFNDNSAQIQAANNACVFWQQTGIISGALTKGGLIGTKAKLVMPKQWFITKTVTINMGYISVDLNGGIGIAALGGNYNAHPIKTGYTVALDFKSEVLNNSEDFVAAYYSHQIMKDGTLICGGLNADGSIARAALNNTKIFAACYRGVNETVRTAVGLIENVSYSCFGVGFGNGDYGWGYVHKDCKFDHCYEPFILSAAADNGELYRMDNVVLFNCGTLGSLGDWTGDFQWVGGSWDYFTVRGFDLGTGEGTTSLSIGRLEWNPATVGLVIDGSNSKRSCEFGGALVNMAAPSTASPVTGVMFKSARHRQFRLRYMEWIDNSASANLTRNLKVTDDFMVDMDGMYAKTLVDYFVTPGCINAVGLAGWRVVNASNTLTVNRDYANNKLSISSSLTSAGNQQVTIFIPLRQRKLFDKVTALVTLADGSGLTGTLNYQMGGIDPEGTVVVSYGVDNNQNSDYALVAGANSPVMEGSNYTANTSYGGQPHATEDGLLVTIKCNNLISTGSAIQLDAVRSGAVTI